MTLMTGRSLVAWVVLWISLMDILVVCLLPLSRCLKRIAAVTRPKTAPYLGDVTQKSIPINEMVTGNLQRDKMLTGELKRRLRGLR